MQQHFTSNGAGYAASHLRGDLVAALRSAAASLLLDPAPDRKRAEKVEGFKIVLEAYEALARATSTSTPGFEMRDLPEHEREAHAQAKHLLALLSTVYPPVAGA